MFKKGRMDTCRKMQGMCTKRKLTKGLAKDYSGLYKGLFRPWTFDFRKRD